MAQEFTDLTGFGTDSDYSADGPEFTDWTGYRGADESFIVTWRRGFERRTGYEPGQEELEPTVFYLANIIVKPTDRKLGSVVMGHVVDLARAQQCDTMRMDVIDPHIISITEKLRRKGLVDRCFYLPIRDHGVRIKLPTDQFSNSPDTVTPPEAIDFLKTCQQAGELWSVDTVVCL